MQCLHESSLISMQTHIEYAQTITVHHLSILVCSYRTPKNENIKNKNRNEKGMRWKEMKGVE